jgi:hypothetical protein
MLHYGNYKESSMGGQGLMSSAITGTSGNAQAPSYGNKNLQNAATNFQTQYGSNPFVQAAQANTMGNIQGAQTATAANRVNQSTPFGSLEYTQTGTDASGNPIWSANQTFSPEVAGTMSQLTNQIGQNVGQGFNPNCLLMALTLMKLTQMQLCADLNLCNNASKSH